MPYNSVAECFHTKKLLQQTFFERSTLLEEKMVNLRFEPPCGWGVKADIIRVWVAGKTV